MYQFYLGDILLPITPSKLNIKAPFQSRSLHLIDMGEVNVLKSAGLRSFTFETCLPSSRYPFCNYEKGFQSPWYYLYEIEKLRTNGQPFYFKILRTKPKGDLIFHSIFKVSMEGYEIQENAGYGFDIMVNIHLKEFREYHVKILEIDQMGAGIAKKIRPSMKEMPKSYVVVKGDSLWEICKRELGNGNKYKEIAQLNKIANPNKLAIGQVIRFE